MIRIARPISTHLHAAGVVRRCLVATTSYSYSPTTSRAISSFLHSSIPARSTKEFRTFSTAVSSLTQDHHEKEIQPEPPKPGKKQRVYSWIDAEAESLIAKAYERHLNKQEDKEVTKEDKKVTKEAKESYPPSLVLSDLEKIGKPQHFEPQNWVDRAAYGLMRFLRIFTHGFFGNKHSSHAVCLETLASVPGLVGAFHRHLRSLRRMKRDHNWIKNLLEESENERMHLLIFLKVTNPTRLERAIVIITQAAYLSFYSALYLVSGRAAHRLTGYLEEEAFRAYTNYLQALDSGAIATTPAPDIARQYYRLAENATIRDVVLHVRADEAMHRDVNHLFANKYYAGDLDSPLTPMSKDALEEERKADGGQESHSDSDEKNFVSHEPSVKLSTDKDYQPMDAVDNKKNQHM